MPARSAALMGWSDEASEDTPALAAGGPDHVGRCGWRGLLLAVPALGFITLGLRLLVPQHSASLRPVVQLFQEFDDPLAEVEIPKERIDQVTLDTGRAYRIESANAAGLYLNAGGGGASNGTNVEVWNCSGDEDPSSIQWRFAATGSPTSGIYTIENVNAPGMFLRVAGQAEGGNVQIWGTNTSSDSRWRAVMVGKSLFAFESMKQAGAYLNVQEVTVDGSNVQVGHGMVSYHSRWRLHARTEHDWVIATDPAAGNTFWVTRSTNESGWEFPLQGDETVPSGDEGEDEVEDDEGGGSNSCSATCTLKGADFNVSCRERIQWIASSVFKSSPDTACWQGLKQAHEECPACRNCGLADAKCRTEESNTSDGNSFSARLHGNHSTSVWGNRSINTTEGCEWIANDDCEVETELACGCRRANSWGPCKQCSNSTSRRAWDDWTPSYDTSWYPGWDGMNFVSLSGVDSGAICTDGSSAGYYWQEGAPGSNLWILYLDGGGWCTSQQSCSYRCWNQGEPHCSSYSYPQTMYANFDTILKPAHGNGMQGANKIFVPYCTSDAHMGNADMWGFYFRGTRVVKAVLADLVRSHGLGQWYNKDKLLFGGGSAGARGALVHLDYVPGMLGEAGAAQGGVQVKGYLDSPLWIDMTPYSGDKTVLVDQTKEMFWNMNVEHKSDSCMGEHQGDEGWKCIFPEYRIHHLGQSFMLVGSKYDSFQLDQYLWGIPQDQGGIGFAMNLAGKMTSIVDSLVQGKDALIFLSACTTHTRSVEGGISGYNVYGTSIEAAVEQFLGLAYSFEGTDLIDRCEGWLCGCR